MGCSKCRFDDGEIWEGNGKAAYFAGYCSSCDAGRALIEEENQRYYGGHGSSLSDHPAGCTCGAHMQQAQARYEQAERMKRLQPYLD